MTLARILFKKYPCNLVVVIFLFLEILPRGQISQNGRIRTHHVFVGSLTLRPKKCGTYVTFTRHRTNFRPAEKFDRTLCSFLYFHFVHTEI